MFTDKQRDFIEDCLKGKRIKRTRNKTMIRKRLEKTFLPAPETAEKFVGDFDLLCTYFSDKAPELILKSLVKKYGKQKILDILKH